MCGNVVGNGAEVVMPLLSIVIANYNYGRFLEEAIRSVVLQDGFAECELIVVDGGSTDNSVEIIKKYADRIAWWCSERDGGQSAAFNKGIWHAAGKYITWLNADDLLVVGALRAIADGVRRHPDFDWFTANFYRFIHESGKVSEIGWGPHWYPTWLQRKNSPVVAFGPSTIFSKRIWEKYGKFDEDLHYVMDTEMWIRFMVNGVKQWRINSFIWAFRMHGESKTAEFGEHKVSPKRRAKIDAERQVYLNRSGYSASKVMALLLRMWRIIDGSYFYSKFLSLMKVGCEA